MHASWVCVCTCVCFCLTEKINKCAKIYGTASLVILWSQNVLFFLNSRILVSTIPLFWIAGRGEKKWQVKAQKESKSSCFSRLNIAWPWATHSTFKDINILICRVGIMILVLSTSEGHCGSQWDKRCEKTLFKMLTSWWIIYITF